VRHVWIPVSVKVYRSLPLLLLVVVGVWGRLLLGVSAALVRRRPLWLVWLFLSWY